MPDPHGVNPHNFKISKILFNNGDFSIAYGTWEQRDKVIAMRWNGNETDKGYPKTFGHPVWFIVHDDLKDVIIKALLDKCPSFLLDNA